MLFWKIEKQILEIAMYLVTPAVGHCMRAEDD